MSILLSTQATRSLSFWKSVSVARILSTTKTKTGVRIITAFLDVIRRAGYNSITTVCIGRHYKERHSQNVAILGMVEGGSCQATKRATTQQQQHQPEVAGQDLALSVERNCSCTGGKVFCCWLLAVSDKAL
jgi:hypothetical protein